MINLLEPSVRRALTLQYQFRRAAALLVLLSVALLIGAVSLLPAYLVSKAKEAEVALSAGALEESLAVREKNALSIELSALREKLNVLEQDPPGTLFTSLSAALAARPSTVSLNSFSYAKKGVEGELQITGVASTRDGLLSYQKELQKNSLFKKVDLPISNLAREREIDFIMTLGGSF